MRTSQDIPSHRTILTVVGDGSRPSGGSTELTTLSKKTPCHCMLGGVCPSLHHSSCHITCRIHFFAIRRKHRVVGAHPRRLDLDRVFTITGDCRVKDGRCGRIFRVTIHVCDSSPITGLGTTGVTLSGGSLSTTHACLTGTNGDPRTVRTHNILGLLSKGLSRTKGLLRRTGTTNIGRTTTGLSRLHGGRTSGRLFSDFR